MNLPEKPGVLAATADAIGKENVNIGAFAAVAPGQTDEVRFLVDDPGAAERPLVEAGYTVRRLEVLAIRISNSPGELAAHAERLTKAGINIEGGCLASADDGDHFEFIFEVGDVKAAKRALK